MPKLPDRKMWDSRTRSYMTYPGIPPVKIEVGETYELIYVDARFLDGRFEAVRVRTFKNGRRWELKSVDPWPGIMSAFLYEREILEVNDREIVVGMPWNYAKFNAHHSDHRGSGLRVLKPAA